MIYQTFLASFLEGKHTVLKVERQDPKMQCLTFVSAHPIIDAEEALEKVIVKLC